MTVAAASTDQSDNEPNYLAMSDEEIRNLDLAALSTDTSNVEQSKPVEVESSTDDEVSTSNGETVDSNVSTDDNDDDQIDPSTNGVANAFNAESTANTLPSDSNSATETAKPSDTTDAANTDANTVVNKDLHTAFFNVVTAPFKANGVEMQITDPAEAVRFMQMGLNYTKKMQDLAEPRRIYKMLNDAGVANTETLSYLIDLHQKNPDAIAKLVKDSEFDVYSVEDDKVDNYVPSDKAPKANAIALGDIMEELQETPEGVQVIQIAGKLWDNSSRAFIVQNPAYLKQLEEHVISGVYAQIQQIMTTEKAKGKFTEYSDIELFNAIGDDLFKKNQLVTQTAPNKTVIPKSTPSVPKKSPEELALKRRQAGTTKSTSSTGVQPNINYLAMSDTEIAKLI